MKNINTLGEEFTKRHDWVLGITRFCGVAICGGCAAAISKNRTDYVPADIDLVTTQEGALQYISMINRFLIGKSNHFRIYANAQNDFVPYPAVAHYRITTNFWLPICIFILPPEEFRYYRIQGGYMLQLPQDVKKAADLLTERDEKPRMASEEIEDLVVEDGVIEDKDPYDDRVARYQQSLEKADYDPAPWEKGDDEGKCRK